THPDFPWHKLREEKNGIYEKGIDPPPSPTEWFHARIVVAEKQIKVYVNNATTPSLTVDKLNTRKNGLIGLSNEGLEGDFANLTITK
ncbi:MAG TPA: family 16 glycoside hydrolase, partial [Chryseolinea sp.]|nr:family 16 glycoside hydrolase [Chryseolinea sp.]